MSIIIVYNMEKQYKLGSLLGGNSNPDEEAVENMLKQINDVGGMLHFSISKEEDGWSAQCDEIPGIITGGTSATPTDEEIETNIRAAIHSAFNLSSKVRSEEVIFESAITEVRTFELTSA